MRNLFAMQGMTAVVTGAAGGLGRAMALALAASGCDVAAVDVQEAEETAALLRAEGVRARAYVCDIAERDQVFALAARVGEDFGRVDALINNAGVFQGGPAEEMDFAGDWRRVMRVNVDGTFSMCQAFGRAMLARGAGSIVNIASKSGVVPDTPNKQTAYNVSKAAIIMLTKSLAAEWSPRGVRVNCICPGNFCARPDVPALQPGHPLGEAWKRHIPLGRFGQPEELGGAAVYLCGPAAGYVTGEILLVDGGYTVV